MGRVALTGAILMGLRAEPALAQTSDFVAAVAAFVGSMSVAAPACGVRDRVWAVRLTGRFMSAVNGLTSDVQPQALDQLAQSQREARDAVGRDRRGYCAANVTDERMGHLDSLADGAMAFW